jgi:AcrR family transcriptional regulator
MKKAAILNAAIDLARDCCYWNLRREHIGARAGLSGALVAYYYGDMEGIQNAVVDEAIKRRDGVILAQAIVARHPSVSDIPNALRNVARRAI